MRKFLRTFFIVILPLMFLTSCGPNVSDNVIPSYKVLSSEEVRNVISNAIPPLTMFPKIILSDENYILPTEDWVKNQFSKELNAFTFYYKVQRTSDNRNDCDNYSLYGRTVANILNVHNTKKINAGIAVGELGYVGSLYGHAINFIITSDNFGNVKVIYYEPQAYQIITLTDGMWAPLVFNM